MNVQKPVITRAADWLVEAGYLERKDDPTDRRSVLLVPTRAGRKFWQTLTDVREAA